MYTSEKIDNISIDTFMRGNVNKESGWICQINISINSVLGNACCCFFIIIAQWGELGGILTVHEVDGLWGRDFSWCL